MLSACSNMLFYPIKPHLIDPANRGIEYQDIYFQSENQQKIHGWLLPHKGDLRGTVVFFHGNGENISTHIGAVYWLPEHGYRVVLIDYRGYGKSEGKATLDGSINDIKKTIEFAYKNYSSRKPFVVLAQSIGGSMSIFAIANSKYKKNIDALILVAPFSDYHKIVRETLSRSWLTWLFQYPLSWTVSNEYKPTDYIKKVQPIPVYFIHGTEDNLIVPEHSRKLYELAADPKKLYLVEGGHNDLAAKTEFKNLLLKILEEMVDQKK